MISTMVFSRSIENLIASFRGLPGDASYSYCRETKVIGDVLEKALRPFNLETTSLQAVLADNWRAILGPNLCDRAVPDGLTPKQQLVIRVSSAAVRTELQFQKRGLLKKIQELPGTNIIKDLTFRL